MVARLMLDTPQAKRSIPRLMLDTPRRISIPRLKLDAVPQQKIKMGPIPRIMLDKKPPLPREKLDKPKRLEIDHTAVCWMKRYAAANLWRVPDWYDMRTLVNDGYLTWYRIVEGQMLRGPRKSGEAVSVMHCYQYITSRPHIMRLFQSTYKQHITDLSNTRTGLGEKHFDDLAAAGGEGGSVDFAETEDTKLANIYKRDSQKQSARERMKQIKKSAPLAVRKAIGFLTTKDKSKLPPRIILNNGLCETPAQWLCRVTGYTGSAVELLKQVQSRLIAVDA